MISEQDKIDLMNGAFGINRAGQKVKYVGTVASDKKLHLVAMLNKDNNVCDLIYVNEVFAISSTGEYRSDVVGLWENRAEPFDLERALAGEPVRLRCGLKAYIKYVMREDYTGSYPLNGYIIDPDEPEGILVEQWTLDGKDLVPSDNRANDIIGMWKEPEPAPSTVTVTLPRALKGPQDEMWFVDSEGYMKLGYGKCVSTEAFNRRVFFGSEEDAKAWFDAMQNSRK